MGTTCGRRQGKEKRVEYGAHLLEDVVEDGVVAGGEWVSMHAIDSTCHDRGTGKWEGNTGNTRNDENRGTYAS